MAGLRKVEGNHLPPKPAPKPGIYVFNALLSVLFMKLISSFMEHQFSEEGVSFKRTIDEKPAKHNHVKILCVFHCCNVILVI